MQTSMKEISKSKPPETKYHRSMVANTMKNQSIYWKIDLQRTTIIDGAFAKYKGPASSTSMENQQQIVAESILEEVCRNGANRIRNEIKMKPPAPFKNKQTSTWT